jgi:CDP-diacylglycerol--inositol 3-phosphatidyltransferase
LGSEAILLQQCTKKVLIKFGHLLTPLQKVLFTFCAMNELFFIALYLLSFSSPLLSQKLNQPIDSPSTLQPGSPAPPKPSILFTNPWSAGAMEMAR